MAQKRTAGFNVTIGTDVVGCITGWDMETSVSEEDVSCLGDTVGDPPIVQQQFLPTQVEHTASVTGRSIFDDAGQSAIETAADAGSTVTLELRYYDGSGYDIEGYFTSYSISGDQDQFAETFTGEFRVIDKTIVTAS